MTVCIAIICEDTSGPAVLVCADKLISAGIRFESGSSKIIQLANCVVMGASEDTGISELILKRFRYNLKPEQYYSVTNLSTILSQECTIFKKNMLDREVISKYNLVIEKLHIHSDSLSSDAIDELEKYDYPEFEFIVTGLDSAGAHIYTVDQDGSIKSWDFLGFTAIGSGSSLASLEMTKWMYPARQLLSLGIPRMYLAKRASERAEGVGTNTDYGILTYKKQHNSEDTVVKLTYLSELPDLMKTLDNAYNKILQNEADTIIEIQSSIEKMRKNSSEQNQESEATPLVD